MLEKIRRKEDSGNDIFTKISHEILAASHIESIKTSLAGNATEILKELENRLSVLK